MDTCVMAAQLLAQCLNGEVGTHRVGMAPPEMAPDRGDPARSPSVSPSVSATVNPPACEAWGRTPKPKANGEANGCTVAARPDPPATGLPPSLPLHDAPIAIEQSPSQPLVATTTAVSATPLPPVPMARIQPTVATPSPTLAWATGAPTAVTRMNGGSPLRNQADRLGAPASSDPWPTSGSRPSNGSQMYALRQASLQAGQMYTRANPQRYQNQWQRTTATPTHQDWQALLQREAAVMAQAQGRNRLTVIVGDSLALWMPPEALPQNRFWLNQSISGETTAHMLRRLHYFASARPDTIHIMAGINDLKQGASEDSVVRNLQQMVGRLRQQHPQAQIVVHSILPTRWESLPSDRIQRVNGRLAQLAQQPRVTFVDLQTAFADDQGQLRRELTTDGLHLSRQGYAVWRTALVSY